MHLQLYTYTYVIVDNCKLRTFFFRFVSGCWVKASTLKTIFLPKYYLHCVKCKKEIALFMKPYFSQCMLECPGNSTMVPDARLAFNRRHVT